MRSRNPSARSRSRSKSVGRRRATSTRSASAARGAKVNSTRAVMSPEKAYYANVERRFTPERDQWNGVYEFGGPLGTLAIMLFSHLIIYYFYVCISKFEGTMIYPGHTMLNGKSMLKVFLRYLYETARPTRKAFGIFWAFLFLQYILAVILPGLSVKGLPLASENGYRLSYRCNAVWAWYVMLFVVFILHYTGIFPLNELCRHYGEYLTAATISADFISIWCYFAGLARQIRVTPSCIYNFFMGSALNYRLPGDVDVKLFAECRNSWVLLTLLTTSCALEQYNDLGRMTNNMRFILIAQFLYSNAVQKGEECVPSTWDIFYEKFGWMLAYWNTCGVPFLYCMQAFYIQKVLKGSEYPNYIFFIMLIVLLVAYYIWDVCNSQKDRFRMRRNGVPIEVIQRRTFPQLPWRYLENPRTLKSSKGEILIDGFYRYGRKINYSSDLLMSFLWCSSCGFESFIPFFYFFFFLIHLIHRVKRDDARCEAKYGELWHEYKRVVPYIFIPYVY